MDPFDSEVTFCKNCIEKQRRERSDFALFYQCEDCEDPIVVEFKCLCSAIRNLSHLHVPNPHPRKLSAENAVEQLNPEIDDRP